MSKKPTQSSVNLQTTERLFDDWYSTLHSPIVLENKAPAHPNAESQNLPPLSHSHHRQSNPPPSTPPPAKMTRAVKNTTLPAQQLSPPQHPNTPSTPPTRKTCTVKNAPPPSPGDIATAQAQAHHKALLFHEDVLSQDEDGPRPSVPEMKRLGRRKALRKGQLMGEGQLVKGKRMPWIRGIGRLGDGGEGSYGPKNESESEESGNGILTFEDPVLPISSPYSGNAERQQPRAVRESRGHVAGVKQATPRSLAVVSGQAKGIEKGEGIEQAEMKNRPSMPRVEQGVKTGVVLPTAEDAGIIQNQFFTPGTRLAPRGAPLKPQQTFAAPRYKGNAATTHQGLEAFRQRLENGRLVRRVKPSSFSSADDDDDDDHDEEDDEDSTTPSEPPTPERPVPSTTSQHTSLPIPMDLDLSRPPSPSINSRKPSINHALVDALEHGFHLSEQERRELGEHILPELSNLAVTGTPGAKRVETLWWKLANPGLFKAHPGEYSPSEAPKMEVNGPEWYMRAWPIWFKGLKEVGGRGKRDVEWVGISGRGRHAMPVVRENRSATTTPAMVPVIRQQTPVVAAHTMIPVVREPNPVATSQATSRLGMGYKLKSQSRERSRARAKAKRIRRTSLQLVLAAAGPNHRLATRLRPH